MAINLQIASNVVDVCNDSPSEGDLFFVDTNVWYWMTYTKISSPTLNCKPYQTKNYPNYFNDALDANCKFYCSGLNVSELIHLVENAEYTIFESNNRGIYKKEFRHNHPKERIEVCSEIKIACDQLHGLSSQLPIHIDSRESLKLVKSFPEYKLDGYDLMNLHAMLSSGITNIITDDGDFTSVPGITVFTANRNVISQAAAQGKLLSR